MKKSTFLITKMDCPSEEQIIRMKLEGVGQIKELQFDLPARLLGVVHDKQVEPIEAMIGELNLNSSYLESVDIVWDKPSSTSIQSKALWIILTINFSLFVAEIITGFIANSMGLVADSLDMLADSFVYGLSLYAVGGILTRKKRIAKFSGYFQLSLAVLGFLEVLRRFLGDVEMPSFEIMIIVSLFALAGNWLSLLVLQRAKSNEVHMKASMIFTSNDIIVNLGVILAGVIVYITNSNFPDLLIGSLVFILVLRGAIRILKLAR